MCLPSCRPGFESQAHHLQLLSLIVKFVLYLSCEKYEKKQKEPEFGPILSFRFRQIDRTMQICKEKLKIADRLKTDLSLSLSLSLSFSLAKKFQNFSALGCLFEFECCTCFASKENFKIFKSPLFKYRDFVDPT